MKHSEPLPPSDQRPEALRLATVSLQTTPDFVESAFTADEGTRFSARTFRPMAWLRVVVLPSRAHIQQNESAKSRTSATLMLLPPTQLRAPLTVWQDCSENGFECAYVRRGSGGSRLVLDFSSKWWVPRSSSSSQRSQDGTRKVPQCCRWLCPTLSKGPISSIRVDQESEPIRLRYCR